MVERAGKTDRRVWDLGYEGRQAHPGVERSDAVRNRRRILEAASVLFEERGVTRVTMEDISRAAGVGKGTLYRRFPNKGLLCQELLDEPTRKFQQETMEILGASGPGPLEKLDLFIDRLVHFTDQNLDLLYGGHEPLGGADRMARFAHPAHDWRRWTVLGLLKSAELDEALDLDYLAAALLAPLDLDFFYYQRRVQGISVDRISAGLRSLVPRSL